MRIALLSYDFGEYCVRLASALAREADVMLVIPDRLAEPFLGSLDAAVRYRPFSKPRLRQPLRQIAAHARIAREIAAFAPDVIHLQQGHLWGNLALGLMRRAPVVVTVHDPQHHLGDRGGQNTPQSILDRGFRRARAIIVHADELGRQLVERLGIDDEVIHTVPHIAIGGTAEAGRGGDEVDGTVLFFGRIWPYKGLDYLIRAEPAISAAIPGVRIVIAGEGEDFDRYERMMVHRERFVVINEYVSEARAAELFAQASVVVLPYAEASQSGVIPVAYTHAKAVIATRVGGLPEMVDHGETGLLVPPRDERSLAEAIVRLLLDGEERRAMGERGRMKLQAECGPEAVAARTHVVYREAVASR